MEDIFIAKEGISMNIFPRYQGKDVKATKEVADELCQLKKDLWDVLEILENGYGCSSSRRNRNILEKCVRKGNDVYKAVVADRGSYLLTIHFGKFSYKRR
ncbi:hypothetical protein HYV85_00245 [Candidatus Woesearchaeota archaeon]|nr:hypothetical protein [Candidatus Woesearchaeota archaeon]